MKRLYLLLMLTITSFAAQSQKCFKMTRYYHDDKDSIILEAITAKALTPITALAGVESIDRTVDNIYFNLDDYWCTIYVPETHTRYRAMCSRGARSELHQYFLFLVDRARKDRDELLCTSQ